MKAITHLIALALGSVLALGGAHFYHPVKHTGTLYVAGYIENLGFIMVRPNGEGLVMKFDETLKLNSGTILHDVAYTDVNRTTRHLEYIANAH